MTDVNLTERVARALLRQQTNGLCDLGRVCDSCDCFAHVDGGKGRDARVLAEASDLLAILRSPEVVAGIAGVLAEHGGFVQAEDNTEVRCSCGHLLWLIGVGFTAGPVSGKGDLDVVAHRRHLARAVVDWLTGGAR